MTELEKKKIGERIRRERKRKHLLQSELAEQAGVTAMYITKIEGGQRVPSLDTFLDIIRVLDVPAETILSDRYDGTDHKPVCLKEYESRLERIPEEERKRVLRLFDAQIREFEDNP